MDRPSDKVLIEYYTSSLGPELAMFSKMKVKPTLVEAYQEAERVEAESGSIEEYPDSVEEKTALRRSSLLFEPKEAQSRDCHEMMRVLQGLYNRVVELEKERDIQATNKLPHARKENDNQRQFSTPSNMASINITEIGGDDFCTFHQQPHSEKKCPQWIHSVT